MRTAFIGTSGFAATVLGRLAASPHRPELVLTRPDAPRGRGRRLAPPPVAAAARGLGLAVIQPASVNDEAARAAIAAAAPDVVCVCAYGGLIREPLLSSRRMLNVHPSLLPRWRGAAPIERAIMAGDERTGVSIIELTEELDSGPILLQRDEPIGPRETYGSLAPRLAELGGELLVRALEESPEPVRQPADGVTYAEKIGPEDRRLDPSRPAAELERTVRALTPHIGAWVALSGESRLGVRLAEVVADGGGEPPGTLLVRDGAPILVCGERALLLVAVRPPGGREMTGAEWARGHLR